jgi:hypothetical protein
MLGSYKPYTINKLRQNYPDIWLKHYALDESGNPTKHVSKYGRPYLLPDLDGGVYMPKGHEGRLTIRELQEHSIIVEDISKVFQVNEEYIKDLADLTEVSKVKKKKSVNNQKNQDRALAAYVATLKEYLKEAGGHDELILRESYLFTVKGGMPTRVFVFDPETPRTCFCTKHVHDSNGFRITWGHKKAIYHCYSEKCKGQPKEMENLEITHMKRMQQTERAKNTHLILEAPPGWEYEKRTDPWVQSLEYTRKGRTHGFNRSSQTSKSTAWSPSKPTWGPENQ